MIFIKQHLKELKDFNMENINTYIIEKLKISKDTKLNTFKNGDRCLEIFFYDVNTFGHNKQAFVAFVPCSITLIDKKTVHLRYDLEDTPSTYSFKYKEIKNGIIYSKPTNISIIVLNKTNALEVLKELQEHDKWINYFKIYNKGKEFTSSNVVPIKNDGEHFITDDNVKDYINYLESK